MSGVYGSRTSVSIAGSRAEIEKDLKRFKADAFAYAEDGRRRMIQFRIGGTLARLEMIAPAIARDEQVKWRALALYVRARLAAVEAGIVTIEDAFLSEIVLPDGQRVGSWLRPQLAVAYSNGKQPAMLPPPDADRGGLRG